MHDSPEVADAQSPPVDGPGPPADAESPGTRRACRWLTAAAWVAGSLALWALYLRISRSSLVNTDGANDSLQAWDMLHGNVLLHGWVTGDANFYFFELPLNAIAEAIFGLGVFAAHAASALAYLFVTLCAAALAMTGSRGPGGPLRGGRHGARRAAADRAVHAPRS